MVQQRIFSAPTRRRSFSTLTEKAKDFLLREGTDMKYGARHLKRAVDRHLVHPLSNLIATGQVRGGDLIRVDYDPALGALTFFKDSRRHARLRDGANGRYVDRAAAPALSPPAPPRNQFARRTAKTSNNKR